MGCDELETALEALADGTRPPTAAELDHLAACGACQARLELARSIDSFLATRQTAQPPPMFTAAVMARVGADRWHTERVVDIGFNIALALGGLVIAASALGFAWAIGLFSITIDVDAMQLALRGVIDEPVGIPMQTTVPAVVLLVMTLGLWWWAETDSTA